MELSPEDQLRLNVLLANPIQAIRIDEQRMTLHALSESGEATVKLNPTGRTDQYLKRVRELLSGQVLGSPGGYPVYLKRWTRMGQARDENLGQLLKLGEPEAVVAVAGAPGLTDDLARRVWWASPTSDTARCMLERKAVVEGEMGKILADHLVEHLAFETEAITMIDSIRLVLQPGLISEETRKKLWDMGRRKRAYFVGFMQAMADELPEPEPARADLPAHVGPLQDLAAGGNPYAALLRKVLDAPGQTFIKVAQAALEKPYAQDDVVAAVNAIEDYFRFSERLRQSEAERDITAIIEQAEACCATADDPMVAQLLASVPTLRAEIKALLVLARCGEAVVVPVFARTDAIGTVMRRKLEPVTQPMFDQFRILRTGA